MSEQLIRTREFGLMGAGGEIGNWKCQTQANQQKRTQERSDPHPLPSYPILHCQMSLSSIQLFQLLASARRAIAFICQNCDTKHFISPFNLTSWRKKISWSICPISSNCCPKHSIIHTLGLLVCSNVHLNVSDQISFFKRDSFKFKFTTCSRYLALLALLTLFSITLLKFLHTDKLTSFVTLFFKACLLSPECKHCDGREHVVLFRSVTSGPGTVL